MLNLVTITFKVNDVRCLNGDWIFLLVGVQIQIYATVAEVQMEVSDVSEVGSGQALHESRRMGKEHVGDASLIGDGFVKRHVHMTCVQLKSAALVEERQDLSTDYARGVADWRLALGIRVVVRDEILNVDSFAKFGGQIKKAVETVVFVVILLKFRFEVSRCDIRIW
jgi:hypothetical protein